MNFQKHYEARKIISEFLKKDLLGPVYDDEIISDSTPDKYYLLGRLFPQKTKNEQENQETAGTEDGLDIAEQPVNLYYSYLPSSMALSFTINAGIDQLEVEYGFAWYELERRKDDSDHSSDFWHRKSEHKTEIIIVDKPFVKIGIHQGLELQTWLHKTYADGAKTLTVAMVNIWQSEMSQKVDNQHTFFQPFIRIRGIEGHEKVFIEKKLRVELNHDPELLNLEMLYRYQHVFATGHGCSVEWIASEGFASEIFSTFMPEYDLLLVKPAGDVPENVLRFSFLANGQKAQVIKQLHGFMDCYAEWLKQRKKEIPQLHSKYHSAAHNNLSNGEDALERIREGIDLLEDNNDILRAFQMVNLAMLRQRETRKGAGNADQEKWYPFQLAFILQELSSIANPDDSNRNVVDLLWFPTGGGKTEAYLGLSAFTIFLRRIRATINGNKGNGVTVLMRYTLRLLTLQQFERASGLICACELIRRENSNLLGQEEISTGLWVGGGLTPNKLEEAKSNLNIICQKGFDALPDDKANPCQILTCPWCGEVIRPAYYSCTNNRMTIHCPSETCPFSSGLPVYLVDEDLYNLRPSLIVATLDKFARMTWEPNVGRLFALDDPSILPPELVIQDELHLISGPLGTIAGLYEVAIERFCQNNGISAKIISSTATIRNAGNQINSLYGRKFKQFPPQGLDMRDSFFARESSPDEKPSRKYIGIMAPGSSGNTLMIRVYSILLFATRYLKDLKDYGFADSEIDSFWTLTGYFNSLRQLGGAVVNVLDDVNGRIKYLKGTKFSKLVPKHSTALESPYLDELTSRKANAEIGKTLKQLEAGYPDQGVLDVILASNMLSVGIDIGRLGLMVVQGQPKSNSEYIQATSRVGRQSPGLIVTLHDASRYLAP